MPSYFIDQELRWKVVVRRICRLHLACLGTATFIAFHLVWLGEVEWMDTVGVFLVAFGCSLCAAVHFNMEEVPLARSVRVVFPFLPLLIAMQACRGDC